MPYPRCLPARGVPPSSVIGYFAFASGFMDDTHRYEIKEEQGVITYATDKTDQSKQRVRVGEIRPLPGKRAER